MTQARTLPCWAQHRRVAVTLGHVVLGSIVSGLSGLSGLPGQVAHAEPARWSLSLEGGSEYDTNIHRFEVFDDDSNIVAAPLVRGAARLNLGWRPRREQRLFLAMYGGAKLFASEQGQDENLTIVAGDGRYQWSVPSRSAVLGVRGTYYDTFGYDLASDHERMIEQRNVAIASGEVELAVAGPDGHQLTLSGGYRSFRYKPDADFDWLGEHAGVRYQATIWLGSSGSDPDASDASLDISAFYGIEHRGYDSPALRNSCPADMMPDQSCPLQPLGQARVDLHHIGSAELIYTGSRIYSARYEAQITDSNSYAQSVIRQRIELGLTTELYAQVFLTAKAALQINTYLDSLLLARDVQSQTPDAIDDFIAIDDENRSSLTLHLSRDLTDAWSIEGRYALFTNALAGPDLSFRRQVFYLGAVYQYDP